MGKKSELLKNTAIIGIGKVCTQFLSFFLLPLYTAILTTEEYGRVDLLETYKTLILYVIYFQIEQALFRFIIDTRKNKKGITEVFTISVLIFLLQSFVFAVILLIANKIFTVQYTLMLFLMVVFAMYSSLALSLCRGLGDYVTFSLGSFLSAAITIVLNVLLVAVFKCGIVGMLSSNILANFCSATILFYKKKAIRYIDFSTISIKKLKAMVKYSLPLVPDVISWWVINAIDKVIISNAIGVHANGIISVSAKFSNAFTSMYNIFNSSWIESVSVHINDEDRDQYISEILEKGWVLCISVAACIVLILSFVFPYLIDAKYNAAYNLVPLFMLATIFNIGLQLYSAILVALKQTMSLAKITVIAAAIDTFANIALVKKIGMYAAPISSIIAYGIVFLFRKYTVEKKISININKLKITFVLAIYIISTILYLLVKSNEIRLAGTTLICALCVIVNWTIIRAIIHKILSAVKIRKD